MIVGFIIFLVYCFAAVVIVGFCDFSSVRLDSKVDHFRRSCSLDALDLTFLSTKEQNIPDIYTLRKMMKFFPQAKVIIFQ